MLTIAIQIGNSDDKLTQREWSAFVSLVDSCIKEHSQAIHFSGAAWGCAPWQNAAWVCEVLRSHIPSLKAHVKRARQQYRQDSVAWLEGSTEFI